VFFIFFFLSAEALWKPIGRDFLLENPEENGEKTEKN